MADSNFEFLKEHEPIFYELAVAAERLFVPDPNASLVKSRQLGEAFTKELATRLNILFDNATPLPTLINEISRKIDLDSRVRTLFFTLRREGNRAAHEFQTSHKQALEGLRLAWEISVWYHRSFGKQGEKFRPGPFVKPSDPSENLRQLQTEIAQLRAILLEANQKLEESKELAALKEQEAQEYAVLAEQMDTEARIYAELAEEKEEAIEVMRQDFERRLHEALAAAQTSEQEAARVKEVKVKTSKATAKVELSEELTRILIDEQLRQAGWEADSEELSYANGARPEPKRNMAIAEWPMAGKLRADYVLFIGLTPVGIVEAKRKNLNIAGVIPQAENYSKSFKLEPGHQPAWMVEGLTAPWPSSEEGRPFLVPFVYSCNGRPYVHQLKEQSGTWFRDCRKQSNIARALMSFHSPDGILDVLKRSREEAEAKLKKESYGYLGLRDYQEKAIHAVEQALEQDRRECLLAMATGTGKTRTIIGLIYRFLKTERFKRILFLVDRTALGNQAQDAFKEAQLEQNQTLAQIYDIKELGDMAPEAETRVQVATVQAMVRRLFQSDEPLPVDQFDCIIVDEAHRGYTLDQEMGEGEQYVRDLSQYVSSYRRVLDYFDAVRIGLTATPAKHTSEIFGKPVYTYSYREAVADDWLIDHEPPIRFETLLSKNGIHFDRGEKVEAIDVRTGDIETAELEDELNFDIEQFNRRVINENFNRVICEQLAQELDPFGQEKTMIFCLTDRHADMVKHLLDESFQALYGENYNAAAVEKITGSVKNVDQAIRRYKNERYPNIAITVDLLTTGIDVPPICNLVFMRRVKSRILYEQMLGRATRRCDEIGKTVFRIYDPVDIYAALEDVSTMKPVVKNPNITIEQLIDEVCDPKSQEAPGGDQGRTHADEALDALSQKVMRILRKAKAKADTNPKLKEHLDALETQWGVAPEKLHQHLHSPGIEQPRPLLASSLGLGLRPTLRVSKIAPSDFVVVNLSPRTRTTNRPACCWSGSKPSELGRRSPNGDAKPQK